MIKIKRAIDLFRLDKFQLIKKINTLELENSVLEQTIKDELYKIFMDKLRKPQELDRVKNKGIKFIDLEPSDFFIDGYRFDLEVYKSIYYRNAKDKFKIDLMLEMKKGGKINE